RERLRLLAVGAPCDTDSGGAHLDLGHCDREDFLMARNNGASVRDGAAAKAEQRKKIIAIGGSVVLVALLAFQLPKTLKRLHPATPGAAPSTSRTAAPG